VLYHHCQEVRRRMNVPTVWTLSEEMRKRGDRKWTRESVLSYREKQV
jgi:hypothetical protein